MNKSTQLLTILSFFFVSLLFSNSTSVTFAEEVHSSSTVVDASADDASGVAVDDPLIETQKDLLSQIREDKKELEALRKKMIGLSGEQQIALGMQMRDTETQLRSKLGELLDLIKRQRKQGVDSTEALKQARALLTEESKIIHGEIDYIQRYIAELQKDQADLEPLALLARKQEISKNKQIYDGLLKDLLENAERMQQIGLSVAEDLLYLDELVKNRVVFVAAEIKLMLSKIDDLKKHMDKASDDDKGKIQTQIVAIEEDKNGATKSLTHLINLMHARGMETTDYSELLIKATGQISREILDGNVALSLFEHWLQFVEEWLRENGIGVIVKIIFIVLILLVFKLLAGITRRLVRKAIGSNVSSLSRLLGDFIVSMSSKLVMLIGLLVALSQLGIKIAPMLAGLGIAGFIIGFALQDVLSNFASGVMILIYQPFDVGDIIEVPEVSGKVQQMNLVSTIVLTFDNQKLVVPNNKIWGNIIRNVHSEYLRRVDLTFGVSYSDDIDHAERVLWEIVKGHELVLSEPEPVIKMHSLNQSSVDFIVRPWTRTINYWEVYWDITRSVKDRFDSEGISIPFPQMDVHLTRSSPEYSSSG